MKKILLAAAICLTGATASAQNWIDGTVYADSMNSTQMDTFKVWLIEYNSSTNILSAVDSQIIAGVGAAYYKFNSPAVGNYRTKAAHLNGQTVAGVGYVPTYHTSSLLWSNADVINFNGQSVWQYHIIMQKGIVTSGPGFVGGNVQQGANKGTANGIEGMTMFLFDANNKLVSYTTTDANGDYSFSNIPNGTYTVHPEQMSYATTPASVTIGAGSVSFTDISFERSNMNKTITQITTGVANVANSEVFTLYPNPATEVVNINWTNKASGQATISMMDIAGKVVKTTAVQMNGKTTLDVSNLQSGIYQLHIATDNGSYTQKIVLQ